MTIEELACAQIDALKQTMIATIGSARQEADRLRDERGASERAERAEKFAAYWGENVEQYAHPLKMEHDLKMLMQIAGLL